MAFTSADFAHASAEFLRHPDLRAISSFFLGWPFSLAIYHLLIHVWNHLISKLLRSNHHSPSGDMVDVEGKSGSATLLADDPGMLVRTFGAFLLVMNLSVAAATLGTFASLLAFNPSNAATSCGACFAVASSGLSAQVIRSTGFVQLSCELKDLRISKVEYIVGLLANVLSFAFYFVIQGLGGGFTVLIRQIPDLVLCYKAHPLGPAIANAAINIIFETYLLARMYTLIVPEFLRAKHRRQSLGDSRLARVLSLLLLDILTVIPNMVSINVAADVVPFSIGAVAVLVAFNYRPPIMTTGNPTIPPISSVDSIPNFEAGSLTASRSRRSSRSAVPGEGGYGFESNVRLRSNCNFPSAHVPLVPSRASVVPSAAMGGIAEHVTTDPGRAEGGAPRAGRYQRGRLADLPRLIIPEVIVKPRPLPVPGSNDVDVQLQDDRNALVEDQRSQTVSAVTAGIRRPIPVGPRALRKIDVPTSSSYVRSSVMSTSAPAMQTVYRMTPITVSPLREDDGVWALSPLASSVMLPVSRNPSESVKTAVSDAKANSLQPPGRLPARYQDLSTADSLGFPIPEKSLRPPRHESIPSKWLPALRASARETPYVAASLGLGRSRFSGSSHLDQRPPTVGVESVVTEDGVILMAPLHGDEGALPAVLPDRPITFGRVTSSGHSDRNSKSTRGHAYDVSSLAERRRASTIRTSIVPPTASSMSTFEIVQIPQIPSRVPRVSES